MKSRCLSKTYSTYLLSIIAILLLYAPATWADTNVGDYIETDTVWNLAGSPYIVTNTFNVQGTDGADGVTTLTIEPGVEVRFNPGCAIIIGEGMGEWGVGLPGSLVAQGEPGNPIVFTSHSEATRPGDWQGIVFQNGLYYPWGPQPTETPPASIFEHCIVEYADTAIRTVEPASPIIRNNTIRNNSGHGISVDSGDFTISGNTFTGNGNHDVTYYFPEGGTFTNNQLGNSFALPRGHLDNFTGNTIQVNGTLPITVPPDWVGRLFSDNTVINSDGDAILELGQGSLTQSAVWPNTVKYKIANNLNINGEEGDGSEASVTLTLNPGVELLFDADVQVIVGSSQSRRGTLIASGTAAAPIKFTSGSTTPSPGSWRGIYFSYPVQSTPSIFEHCIVEYGDGVTANDSAVTIRYSTFQFNQSAGVSLWGVIDPQSVIECNIFKDNAEGIYISDETNVQILRNNFAGNADCGLCEDGESSNPVVAVNNWWNDDQGPNQNGDTATGNVDYTPWLTAPSPCAPGETSNQPPLPAQDPEPEDLEVDVEFASVVFLWTGTDPNLADTLTYEFLLGTASDNLTSQAQNLTLGTHTLTNLSGDTTYYWQVVTRDDSGASTPGPVWSFTTAIPRPDLTISDLTRTPVGSIVAGQTVTFTATVRNSGRAAVSEPFEVRFQLNGQSPGAYTINDNPAPGDSIQISHSWTARVDSTTVEVISDYFSRIAEEDESNNTRTDSLGVVTDTTPPEMSSSTPADGALLSSVNTISIDLDDLFGGSVDTAATATTITVTLDGQPVSGSWVNQSGDRFVFTPDVLPLAHGTYQVAFTAYDTAGNSQGYAFTFSVDSQNPAIPAITGGMVTSGTIQVRPAENRSNNSTVTLTGTREDDTALWINNARRAELGSGPWSFDLNLNQGANPLEVRSRDAAGNFSPSVWVDIHVDTMAPFVTGITPVTLSFLNAPPAGISITYTETGSGLDSGNTVRVLRDGTLTPVAGTWSDTAGRMQFTPSVAFADGTYTLEVRLADLAGNHSGTSSSIFTVDTASPPRPVIDPVTTPSHTVTQTITGRKEAYAAILLDGQQVVPNTAAITWQHTVTLNAGHNILNFTARDRAGNQSDAAPVTITLDDTAPAVVNTLVADGDIDGTTVRLNWTGYNEAAQGDVQSYRIYHETTAFGDVSALSPKATVGAGRFTHDVENLTTNTAYWFAVVAVDAVGNANPLVTAVTATPTDSQPPEEVGDISIQSFADRLIFSWSPSANRSGDLSGYKVYFDNAATPELLTADRTSYERTGLSGASVYPIRITAYDDRDNESTGVNFFGYTWLDNPVGLTAETFSGYVQLNWSPVTPTAHLRHYRIYASTTGPFTSVAGMQPVVTAPGNQTRVAGLTNGQTYYFAVTALNHSNGQRPDVTTISAQPVEDQDGPQISDVRIDGQALTSGHTLDRSSVVTLAATDPAGISRVDFMWSGTLLYTDFGAPYACNLDILAMEDGQHTLEIIAYDTLDNSSSLTFTINVSLAPPGPPVITQPADGTVTNQTEIIIQGQADLNTQVLIYLEGTPLGAPSAVDASGRFSTPVTLAEGDNHIQATAQNRSGAGPMSTAVTITLDTSRPQAPVNAAAQAIEGGEVRLTWQTPAKGKTPVGYHLYRSDADFTDTASATRLTEQPVNAIVYRDLPPSDGQWFYRITSADDAGNESDPSGLLTAASDGTLPRLTAIQYSPSGNVDDISGAMAPGQVGLSLTLSEPLMVTPFFSIAPEGGMPIHIALTQTSETTYTGQFTIEEATPTGTGYAVFSGRDAVGNRGTEIDNGVSILIDTDGPAVRRIVLNPATPIQNDAQAPVTIGITIGLNEAAAAGTAPALEYLLSGPGRSATAINSLTEISPASGDVQTWQAQLELPADAGESEVETLTFAHQSEDGLGNISTRILSPNHFQIYQGDLPPLAAPTGLTATALPNGRVQLSWNPVDNAVGYQLYSQTPAESELTVLTRIDGNTTFTDTTGMDGTYHYAVTSVRNENSQESESGLSPTVSVDADSQAPVTPTSLALSLSNQGIYAQWQSGATETVTFRLYRSDAGVIDTVAGLTPIQVDISNTEALDRTPSPNEHSYVVTAMDEAGNESAPSNSAYLNFDLLPVSTITVVQADNDQPELSWTHPGGDIAGYNVLMGPMGSAVQVTAEPVADLSMEDSGYAGDMREYSIIAVDANGVESPARSIFLPNAEATPVEGNRLRRGIMNTLQYTVSNRSDAPLSNLQVIATLMGIDHPGETFALAANESRTIPVVVGGYTDLAESEPLTTTLKMTPNAGESASIVRGTEILVGEGMLVLQPYFEAMTRGATGKVWFTLENTGEAEIEIVTARNSGQYPSGDIVFSLIDQDGNVLSTMDFKQAAGSQVTTLSNRDTVARIPAGAVFTSDPVQIPVPATTPDNPVLHLGISDIYHHYGRDDELIMRGMDTRRQAAIIETPYNGHIDNISPAVSTGQQEVVITGQALDTDAGTPVPNAALALIITLNGFERNIGITTDPDGGFSYTFTPLPAEAGIYTVAALYPDTMDRPSQATFTVSNIDFQPANIRLNMPKNYERTIPIQVTAAPGTQVHNLRLVRDEWDQRADAFSQGVTHTVSDPIPVLESGQKATIDLTLSSDNSAPDSGSLILRLISDESGTQPWGHVTVEAQFSQAEPYLVHTPNFVETGVLIGEMVTETIRLENKGLADLENLTVSLTGENNTPAPEWVVLSGNTAAGNMAVGDKRDLAVAFAPATAATEGLHTFYLHVRADNYPDTTISVHLSATPDGVGNALFKVTDIFTGTFNASNELIQGLDNARITLQNEKNLSIVHEQRTDALGEALFSDLTAGIYKCRIQADGHQEKISRIWIRPGLTTTDDIFLEYNLITVEWAVVETTIEDKYNIVLNVTYETDVPAPVVVCDPPSVKLPDLKAGDVFNGEFTLTNHGLIRADDLTLILPLDDEYVQYELLVEVPPSLGAKERIVIPYRLTCIKSLSQADDAQTGGGSGCYSNCVSSTYSGVSVNGCPFSGASQTCFNATCKSKDSPSGGGGKVWYSGPGTAQGGCYGPNCSGGSGNGAGAYQSLSSPSEPCVPAPGGDGTSSCCPTGDCPKESKREVCQETGSWVNTFYRSYSDDATDLSVKVPGGAIDIYRAYYNMGYPKYADEWHFMHDRKIDFQIRDRSQSATASSSSGGGGRSSSSRSGSVYSDVTTTDGQKILLRPIKREGILYRPVDNGGNIDLSAGDTIVFRPDQGADSITYLGENMWRWQDKHGRWEDYHFKISQFGTAPSYDTVIEPCKLIAYGDRQGAIAKLLYEEATDKITGMTDRNDRQVIWFTYDESEAGNELIRIRDLTDRSIEYEVSTETVGGFASSYCQTNTHYLIHRFTDTQDIQTLYTYELIPGFKWSSGNSAGGSGGGTASSYGSSGGGGSGSASRDCIQPTPRYALTKVVDGLQREKIISYDTQGGVASVIDEEGNGYHYEYNYDKETKEYYAQIRDTNGKIREILIDPQGQASKVDLNGRTVKTFSNGGNIDIITDENGLETVKRYDQWDNLTEVVYPDGARVTYNYDPSFNKVIEKRDENNIITTYEYDDSGRLILRTDARNTDEERITEFSYNTQGYLETIRRPGDGKTVEAVTTLTYDADGNMETITDPENNVTRFTYDVMGNVLTKTDPLDKVWTYTYDSTGRLKTVRNPLDHLTEYFYDEVGNKIRARDPRGKETVYTYDARDNLKKAVNPALEEALFESTFDGRITQQTDGEGRATHYEYDADGRLSKNIDGNSNEIALDYTASAADCDTCGGGSTNQPSVIEFPTFTRQIKYDERGRKFAQRDMTAEGEQVTRFGYDPAGNLIQKTDAEGKVTTYEYDDLNRLTTVVDADERQTTYTYDNRDNLIALTDAENQTTRFEYDRNNRLVKEIRPMGEETAYDYDSAGNLIQKIDAKNQRTEYLYDDTGRLETLRLYAAGDHSTPVKSTSFTYDNAGNLTGYDDGTTSAVYTYDDAYRKTGETVNYPGFSLDSDYTYYKNGLKKSYTGPDNITYGFLYDQNNQLTGVQIPNVGMFTVNEYKWNRPSKETLPGGAKRLYDYDELMRVANITAQDPGGHDQLTYGYTYDKVDNISAKATGHGDYGYTYDNLYRLTETDNPEGQTDEAYTYDGVGNRLTAADTTGDWGYSDNNELEGFDDTAFQYDANGNMIEKTVGGETTRFFYNSEDRLERVENGSGTVIATYYYDPFGRRLWKDVGATRTHFYYSDEGLVGEFDGVGGQIKSYGWKPGSTWSTDPLFMKIGSQYYWYHNDHLGTPQVMTTSSGAVVWAARYNSFGRITIDTGSSIINHLRLPGQYEDAKTGLYYNRYRYYDSQIGRYLLSDPIGLNGGINLYAYVLNNPANWIDPWGLEQIMIFYATDLKKKNFNDIMLQKLVNPPDKIEQAAKDANKTYKIDKTATKSEIIAAYEAQDTERIIIVAHGADGQPYMVDVNDNSIRPADFDTNKKGKNLTDIDMLSCHQYKYESNWEEALGVDVEPYDDKGYMWWYEMNRALNKDIPPKIK